MWRGELSTRPVRGDHRYGQRGVHVRRRSWSQIWGENGRCVWERLVNRLSGEKGK